MKKNDRFVACDTFCDSFMRPRPRIVLRNSIVVKTEKVINYEPFFARSVFFGVFVDSFQIYNKNPAIFARAVQICIIITTCCCSRND